MKYFLPKTVLGVISLTLLPEAALAFCFEAAGGTFNIAPQLLESIATIESGMNPAAFNRNRNGSTDLGLMQVNSYWVKAAGLDRERLLGDPCYNTRAGARILRSCIDRHGYTWEAVGCFNATSDNKRKAYAWKIFRRLVTDKKKTAPQLSTSSAKPDKKQQSTLTVSFDEQEADWQWSPYPASAVK